MIAATTAKPKQIIPTGAAFNERSLFTSIARTPTKERKSPATFNIDNLFFRKKKAAIGENTGMVAMITALMVAEEYLSPKFSPIKYKKGLKSADRKNSL